MHVSASRFRLFKPVLRAACAMFAPLALATFAEAALPPAIDGQALPSLAPMLEHVTPAVVNINSKTRVRVRDPFFDDRLFASGRFVNGSRVAGGYGCHAVAMGPLELGSEAFDSVAASSHASQSRRIRVRRRALR